MTLPLSRATLALQLREITKRFPGVTALDRVDLDLYRGEIHALVGENGAGKSTLIKILSGVHVADEGDFFVAGKVVAVTRPSAGTTQAASARRVARRTAAIMTSSRARLTTMNVPGSVSRPATRRVQR